MSHKLAVGCVCAENLSQDYINPRRREIELRRTAKQKKPKPALAAPQTWVSRCLGSLPAGWSIVKPGLARTIIGEFEIDLFHNGRLWESSVWRQSSFFGPSKFCHTTLEQAVQAALDKVALEGGGSAA